MHNYIPAPDVLTVFISVVMLVLMHVSYIKKEENFLVFKRIPVFLIVSAAADMLLHKAIAITGPGFNYALYLIYLICNISLILALYSFMEYIRVTLQTEGAGWVKSALLIKITAVLSIIIQGAAPLILKQGLSSYIFVTIYTFDLLILIAMGWRGRHHVYGRILIGSSIPAALSFILMYAQLFMGQTSYTASTFLFPTIALLYLMHSNPYDFTLGAVDADAFEDMVAYSFMHGQSFYLMSLYIRDFETGGMEMPRIIQKKVRYFGEKYYKNAQLFRISEGHLILTFDPVRNREYEEKGKRMLEAFEREYDNFRLDYKIIYMHSTVEISSKCDYLPLLQYLRSRMEENTLLMVSDKDIEGYNNHGYILEQLKDIGLKKDFNDPRVIVFCQPVLNAQTGRNDTAEALMRLRLEKTGMVFPDQFIPLAERHGLIHTLSLIIFAKTCMQIKKLLEDGYNVKRISVNFSMMDVREPDFAEKVKGIVSVIGIPFEKVAIEITESQSERDFELIKERINELKYTGIKFYLDDFGTGYSSFERIMELPFDIIKFDRSLTVASGTDVKLQTMVTYLAHMFTDMNYSVLYEGIEDENDEQRCIGMFARYLQGYKYSRPIPIEQLTGFFYRSS